MLRTDPLYCWLYKTHTYCTQCDSCEKTGEGGMVSGQIYLLHPSKGVIAPRKPISQLWSITCYMRSHRVTCHSTQVNFSQAGRYLTYLPQRDGRLSWPGLHTEIVNLSADTTMLYLGPARSNIDDRDQHINHYNKPLSLPLLPSIVYNQLEICRLVTVSNVFSPNL